VLFAMDTDRVVGAEGAELRRAVSFAAFGSDVRKEVKAAAARGELHPEPVVAASSVEWARARLTRAAGFRSMVSLARRRDQRRGLERFSGRERAYWAVERAAAQ
jgi:hypothetical protein